MLPDKWRVDSLWQNTPWAVNAAHYGVSIYVKVRRLVDRPSRASVFERFRRFTILLHGDIWKHTLWLALSREEGAESPLEGSGDPGSIGDDYVNK